MQEKKNHYNELRTQFWETNCSWEIFLARIQLNFLIKWKLFGRVEIKLFKIICIITRNLFFEGNKLIHCLKNS